MSETAIHDPPLPRIEAEALPAPRLEAEPIALPPLPRRGVTSLTLAGSGATVLILGLAALATGNFVADQFARGGLLGAVTLAVALLGFGLIGVGLWRELRALFALSHVDALRRRLAGADPATVRRAAREWLAELPESQALLPALDSLADPAAIRALLRAGPVAVLRARSDAASRNVALGVFAATAAVPSPALDGLFAAWRGLRLIRQIAELHGLRPGLLGTLALLRRTALSAAMVTATDLAANTAAHALLSNPLLQRLAGDTAGAAVAARRMTLLGRAAAVACCPIE